MGGEMRKSLFVAAFAAVVLVGDISASLAAEVLTPRTTAGATHFRDGNGCRRDWVCGPEGCDWHRVCDRVCPDGFSCYNLYGAYPPYGGTAYWGAYTDSGWGGYYGYR